MRIFCPAIAVRPFILDISSNQSPGALQDGGFNRITHSREPTNGGGPARYSHPNYASLKTGNFPMKPQHFP